MRGWSQCKFGKSSVPAQADRLRPVQGGRWRFAEQGTILRRKSSGLPKPVIHRGLGDGRNVRRGHQKRAPREVHAAQPQILNRSHADMLQAAGAQAAFGCSRRRTDLREIQWLEEILRQELLETPNDSRVISRGIGRRYRHAFDQGIEPSGKPTHHQWRERPQRSLAFHRMLRQGG